MKNLVKIVFGILLIVASVPFVWNDLQMRDLLGFTAICNFISLGLYIIIVNIKELMHK